MTWAIIASGQSLNSNDVLYVKKSMESGKINGVIAVSNVGLDIAPWADALVSHDCSWWNNNRQADNFKGRKFCRNHRYNIETFIPSIKTGCNSGLMAMDVAVKIFGAKRLILLGFDMHGTHYFGKHPKPLRNTTDSRFETHIKQFDSWNGCEVINCTPNSSLKKFPFIELKKAIEYNDGN